MTEIDANKLTTIRLRMGTRERLAALGGKRDTFDDILNRLIDFYESHSP